MTETPKTILLVEDSESDWEVIARSFRSAGLVNTLQWCRDGDEALDFLYRRGEYSAPDSAPTPGIILLDLNLPGTDGREVLKEIKTDSKLKSIPVVVLTTSADERDIEECYKMGANSYIQKPVTIDGYFEAVKSMHNYWFEIAIIPQTDEDG